MNFLYASRCFGFSGIAGLKGSFFEELFSPPWRVNGGLLKFKDHSPNVEDQEPLEKGPEVTSPILGCYVDIYLTIVIFSFNFYMLDLPLIH